MDPDQDPPSHPGGHRVRWTWRVGSRPRAAGAPSADVPPEPASIATSVRDFFLRALSTATGVLLATQIVPGIECATWQGLIAVALLLGLFNAFVRPLLMLLSLPLLIATLGLFLWVINAGLLSLAAYLVKPFSVASFGSALGGAAVISLTSILGNRLLGVRAQPSATATRRSARPPGGRPPPGGSGPVIDV